MDEISLLKADFRNFLSKVWDHVLPGRRPTPIQNDIAHYLQHGPKRKVVEAFRGVGKSWVTVAYVVWRLFRDPQIKILVVSASKTHADNFTTFCLQIINAIPELAFLIPNADQREAKVQFDVGPATPALAPSLKSIGITGQITGNRADLIIADDVETPSNSATQIQRDKLAELVKEFDAVLTAGEKGEVVYLGTPQTEASLYNTLPSRGYAMRVWPARYPVRTDLYGDKLAPIVVAKLKDRKGLPTDPHRFGEMDLQARELSYGRSGFALQFMLDTSLNDANRYPLKLEDLIVMNLNPDDAPSKVIWAASTERVWDSLPAVGLNGDRFYQPMEVQGPWVPYAGSVLAIDPSGRGKDETAYCVLKQLNGQLFLLEWGGLDGGYGPTVLEALAKIAKKHKVNYTVVESNFGDGMFTSMLTPVMAKIYPNTIEEVHHSIQKEKRIIDTLEPVINAHKLVVDRKVVEQDYKNKPGQSLDTSFKYQGFYQLTRITRDRGSLPFDDRIDVLAIGVAYWVEHMSRDTDVALKDYKEAKLEESLRRFVETCVGEPGWETAGGFECVEAS